MTIFNAKGGLHPDDAEVASARKQDAKASTNGAKREDHPAIKRENTQVEIFKEDLSPTRIVSSITVASILCLTAIRSMLYATLFLPDIFVFDMSEDITHVSLFQDLTLLFNLLAVVCVLMLRSVSRTTWRRIGEIFLTAAPLWVCLYMAALAAQIPEPALVAMRLISHFLFGGAMGIAFCNWIRLFAHCTKSCALHVGCSLVLTALCVLGLRLLPTPAASTLVTILPLCVIPLMRHLSTIAQNENGPSAPTTVTESRVKADYHLWLSLLIVGFVSGIAFGYMATSTSSVAICSVVSMVVALVIGLVMVGYFVKTGKNPGFSIPMAVILSLVCMGQGLLSSFGNEYVPLTYGLLFLGTTLLESVLFLQLPFVFKKKKSVRTFLAMWAAYSAAQALGVALRAFLFMGLEPILFRWVSAGTMVLSIGIMAVVLNDRSTSTAWGFLPIPMQSRKRYQSACEAIRDAFKLTPRELEIMSMVGRGRNGTYIQEKLFISKSTYQTHMRNLYKKLDIHSDQELIDIIEEELDREKENNHPSAAVS